MGVALVIGAAEEDVEGRCGRVWARVTRKRMVRFFMVIWNLPSGLRRRSRHSG